jgi:hypothetical protein
MLPHDDGVGRVLLMDVDQEASERRASAKDLGDWFWEQVRGFPGPLRERRGRGETDREELKPAPGGQERLLEKILGFLDRAQNPVAVQL